MIYDMMYRDGSNHKQFFRAKLNPAPLIDELDVTELAMEESGLSVSQFFEHMGWVYDPYYDHNIVSIEAISDDQETEADVVFGGPQKLKKEEESEEEFNDDIENHFAVDIPHVDRIDSGEWTNLETFQTREEAIKWAMEKLGADENGMICVISSF